MRCADRLCSHFLRGCSQSPAKVIQTRRGQRFRRGFLFALVGVLPCWGVLLPCCRPPALFACRLRGGSVLHFLFPGVNSPGFIFLSSCSRPALPCGVCVPSVSVYGVSRGPLRAVPVAVGLAYPVSNAPAWGLLGPSWVVRVQAWPEAGRACSVWAGRFFRRSALIAPPGLPGVRLPAPKSQRVKSRPRQPFSRSAGLNYSRSSSADNSAIFLRIDSFFCAATKSLNAFAANSHL